MDLQSFNIAPDAARRAFLQYKAAFAQTGSAEDGMIMRGYRAIASGKRVISLREVLKAGGLKPDGYPNLAISRADQTRVAVEFDWDGECRFYTMTPRTRRPVPGTRILVPTGTFPAYKDVHGSKTRERMQTMVPSIPPEFRPPYDLKNYHILWEVDTWTIAPPVDPALLKHIGGDLYAVLAVWDLTDLERAVLGITRAQL